MSVPSQLLTQLYRFGSLRNVEGGLALELKNRLLDVTIDGLTRVVIDDFSAPLAQVMFAVDGAEQRPAEPFGAPVRLPIGARVRLFVPHGPLPPGHHELAIEVHSEALGELLIQAEDVLQLEGAPVRSPVPHEDGRDYTMDLVRARQQFVQQFSGVELEHVSKFSFDPARTRGNIENFTGVIQVPMGFAGPIRVHGEHADGEFLVPMATSEGTLVASYNRGIKVLNLAGGVRCTVSADAMQRAPVFIFDSAREAREFCAFVDAHLESIRAAAESTSKVAKLLYIDKYLSNKFAFLRFNYGTGDAAGQNMVGRATLAACQWILGQCTTVRSFYLEANLATDKKHSHVNIMHTRGKRVTAEATVPRDLLVQHLRATPAQLHAHATVGTIGAILSGASNNGAHSPNGITAIFIATGQDVANVAESSAGILFTEVTPEGDLYLSLTIPSLIVATHGGGTGLPTQQECLRVLGCTGPGTVNKLAEIVAGVALAGELSLGAAISSLDWVSSHERMGRHR